MKLTKPSEAARVVGVFDSGVGGLSVLKAIRQNQPSVDLVYIADCANAPYGSRAPEFIERRSQKIAGALIDAGAQLIVVACNTATTVAVQRLRSQYAIPIVAMEPAIKPAVTLSKTGVVAVLATERTLESTSVQSLCRDFGAKARILLQACPGLVEQVESGELASPQTRHMLNEFIQPLLAQGADTLVLGCTHYVFLQSAIQKIAGPQVQIVESSAAVAQQVTKQLGSLGQLGMRRGREIFFTTGSVDRAQLIFSQLWGGKIEVRGCKDRKSDRLLAQDIARKKDGSSVTLGTDASCEQRRIKEHAGRRGWRLLCS